MAQNVQLPDGTLFPMRQGETPEQALMAAAALYPDAFAPKRTPEAAPQSGGIAALKAGFSGLKSDIATLAGRTGIMDPAAAERYIAEQKAYQARTFKPTEEGWTEAPLTKFSELLGGSAAYMAAPLAAGAAAAALPVAAPTATVLGLTAAGSTSFAQFTGSFLSRQMETGKKLGETELGTAALAALPATALDVVSLRMIPGIRNLLGAAGREVTEAQAKEIAQQGLGRTLGDYVATTGKVAGVEGLTESAQQFLERLQAGLSITDKEARDEYIESFLGGAVLGGTLSVPGRFVERGKIKGKAEEVEERERAAARQAREQAQETARLEEEARRKTPEYLDDLEQRFNALKARERELTEATKGKVDTSDPLAVEEKRRARSELGTFKTSKEYKELQEEYRQAYDELRPRVEERKRQERIAAAPEGAQLDIFGQPAGVQDMSLRGQIQTLNQYIGSFDKQIKAAEKAGDTQQVELLRQKQGQAREQIASLMPDPTLLEEAKLRANQRLKEYQKEIEALTSKNLAAIEQKQTLLEDLLKQPEKLRESKLFKDNIETLQEQIAALKKPDPAQTQQLQQLNATANKIREAIADIEKDQKTIERNRPTEVLKAVDKDAERIRLNKELQDRAARGLDIQSTLDELAALEPVAEQPTLFGEEDMREITPQGLGDAIADERARVVALREKLEAERAALQRMAATPQTGTAEEVQRRRKELIEEARKTAAEIQERNKNLYEIEKKQTLLDKLLKQPRTPLVAQGIETLQKQIADLQKKIKAAEPKVTRQQPRTKLLAAVEGEFAPRVTDEQLMEQRDRDIAALLDQYLPGALGVTPTQEVLQIQGPEGPREVRLTTLGGESYQALRQELGNVEERRNAAVERLFESGGATADALRSEIVMLVVREVELKRQLANLDPLSAEYRQDLQSLVRDAFTRTSAIPRTRTPNLAEQAYLDAVEDLKRIEDATLDTIYAMNKLAYYARTKGIPGTTTRSWHYASGEGREIFKPGSVAELIQNDPIMQAGRAAQAQISAAQRRVDEAAKNMPQLPDLTDTTLEDKLDSLAEEFAEGTPKELAALSKARRVPAAQRPAALLGADIPGQIAANERQIEQLNQDIKYAGKPSAAEKVAALDALKEERDRRVEENKRLTEQYNRLQKPEAPAETGEVADMRQELATIERTLASDKKELRQLQEELQRQRREEQTSKVQEEIAELERRIKQFEARARITQQLEAARDELIGRIEAAVGPVRPEAEAPGQLAFPAGIQYKEIAGQLKPVPADDVIKAKTDIVAATDKIEELRKALARVNETGEKYFREVATQTQLQLDKENKSLNNIKDGIERLAKEKEELEEKKSSLSKAKQDAADERLIEIAQRTAELKDLQTVRERRLEAMKDASAEVRYFLNLAEIAGLERKAGKEINLRQKFDQALNAAIADKEKKDAALAELERKQRMYEQQEAARRGIDLGEAEARKITAGKFAGFVTPSGKALKEKPKDKRSWIVSRDSKAKVPKPSAVKTLQDAIQNAAALVGQARADVEKAEAALGQRVPLIEKQIAPLKNSLAKLELEIGKHYSPAQAAEIESEITRLKEQLATVEIPPAIADVAAEYNKASTVTKDKIADTKTTPAARAVAQLDIEKTVALNKAANKLQAAEQAETAADAKIDALRTALIKATKRLEKLKDPKKIQGVKLQIGNLTGSSQKLQADRINAYAARRTAEAEYMAARLERLQLVRQMGEHAKREAANINTQLAAAADTVADLQKQRDTAVANEAAIRTKFNTSSAALEKAEADVEAARQAARNADRSAKEKEKRDALDAAAAAQKRSLDIRTGLGLPGKRVERETAGKVMTAVQAEIRKRLAEAETNLSKAIKTGNTLTIRAATKKVDDITVELAQVYGKAPVVETEVGAVAAARAANLTIKEKAAAYEATQQQLEVAREELKTAVAQNNSAAIEAAETKIDSLMALSEVYSSPTATQPEVVEGMRLPARREGPAVRYVRGGNKAIMQAGVVKLRAEGLSQEAANAIGLYVAKSRIAGAKTPETKKKYQEAFKELTAGRSEEQVNAAVAEGKRLMGLGPTAELIAKREALRQAEEAAATAEKAVNLQASPVAIELARDELVAATERLNAAERAYTLAKDMYEMSQIKRGKQAEKQAIEDLFAVEPDAAELTKLEKAVGKGRAAAAIEGLEEEIAPTRVQYRTIKQTGTGLHLNAVTNLVRRITSQWALVPEIEVVATESQLPENIRKQAEADKMTGRIPGLYDTTTNKVYLVAENLFTPNDVVLTIAHEVAGHFGLRSMLGAQYTAEMDRLYNGNRDVKAKADAKMRDMPSMTQQEATEEVLADLAEKDPSSGLLRRIYDYLKDWFKKTFFGQTVSDKEIAQVVANARRQVMEGGISREAEVGDTRQRYRTAKPKYESENALTELADRVIAQPKSFKEKMGSNLALEAEMNAVDMRAGLQEAIKRGAKDLGKDELFTQAMYNVRKADQFMPLVYTSLSSGPLEFYIDDKGLRGVTSSNKNSAQDVFTAVKNVPGRNTEAKFALASTYMIAQRAANKGLSKLDLGELGVTEADLRSAMAAANADPALKSALEEVRRRYNAYNEGQIKFLADSGKISKAEAAAWLKDGDYVPYYRVRDDGTAELVFGGEKTLTVGDIRTQPYLAELKGGETKILPLNESIIRNTMLITKAALYNNATKEVAYAMQEFGEGKGKDGKNSMPIKKGQGPAGADVIRFTQEPDPRDPDDDGKRWLRINTTNTAMEGIPSELVVKSLEGAHLTLPAFLKIGGIAGDWLRKGVTRMPPYIFRQLIRDPMAASFTGGLNYGPFRAVVMAGTEFLRSSVGQTTASKRLIEKGLVQSGVFSGDPDDMSTFATQLASGKDGPAIDRFLGMLDRAAMRADAATRALVYDSALKNGLSEVEADMMTMESMNFYKRGLSPTVQYANRLIPFMNAQIQGLNVLVKAMRGRMPFEERQKIKRKFWNNGLMLFGVGLIYAMAMDDDETFKNAKPRDKYTNFFVNVPGLDEAMKIPLPYESGWFFTLAVALADAMKAETNNKQQLKALKDIFLSSVPGYSSMFMPQAVKPLLEVFTNKNFFSGQNIESVAMQGRDPEARFTNSTTEVAKALAKVLPLSPVQIEHIARGYFGTAPLAMMAVASGFMRGEEKGEAPERRLSETPIIGSTFQRKYGGADADVMYAFAKEATQRANSLREIQRTGTKEEAKAYLAEHKAEIALAPLARNFETLMGRLRTDEAAIRKRADLNAAEKRERIEKINKTRQDIADKFNAAVRKAEAARAGA